MSLTPDEHSKKQEDDIAFHNREEFEHELRTADALTLSMAGASSDVGDQYYKRGLYSVSVLINRALSLSCSSKSN